MIYKMEFRAVGTGGMSHSSQQSVVYTTSLVAPECLCSVSPCSDLGRVLSLSVCFCWSYGLNAKSLCIGSLAANVMVLRDGAFKR